MPSPTLTLFELNALVRQAIENTITHEYWVEAELADARESRGHCYMELVQKEEGTNTPIARAQAKCWRSQWMMILPHFLRVTGQQLHAGMKVRLKVFPQFHEAYGFAWIVTDIDPTFTLGDMARRRQDIIRRLKEDGVFDLQRELPLPLFCLHIAVISSKTAAGYGDFCQQLSESRFAFDTQLFPATMQGEQVEESIIAALNQIYALNESAFDCVVIIRGGGATADMSGFDTLALAENVAQFPLPIITGIGHDRDECVLDMVSHLRVKTPTAAAAFLIDHAQAVFDSLNDAQNRIARQAQAQISNLKSQISNLALRIPTLFSLVKTRQEACLDALYSQILTKIQQTIVSQQGRIDAFAQRIPLLLERKMSVEGHKLELINERVKALDPTLLLRRGYSITLKDGHAVRDPHQLKKGDKIETHVEKGTIKSTVI